MSNLQSPEDGVADAAELAPDAIPIDFTHTLEHALRLADLGIPVFPVRLKGTKKIPAIKAWWDRATTDEAQIRGWFTGSEFLVGMPTGAKSYDVIDADPRHGGNIWLVENEHRLPRTCRHQTLQDGAHLLFHPREGMESSAGKIAPGVDVRSRAGFVVYWPAHGMAATTDPIADSPDWLVEEMKAAGPRRTVAGSVPLASRKPPSAQAVIELLDAMPNPLEAGRDAWVDVMLAAQGCINALREAHELKGEVGTGLREANRGAADTALREANALEADTADLIGQAAIAWACRWPNADPAYEHEKWADDWSHQAERLAGWQTLNRVADALIPGRRERRAQAQFDTASEPRPTTDAADAAAYPGTPAWPKMLRQTKRGVQPNLLMNVCIALRHAPEWQGVLAKNLLTGNVDVLTELPGDTSDSALRPLEIGSGVDKPPGGKAGRGSTPRPLGIGNVEDAPTNKPGDKPRNAPRPLENLDIARTKEWLEIRRVDAGERLVHSAIKMVAAEHAYHPIRAMLAALPWSGTIHGTDGAPLLDTWLIRHLGVEDTPLHRAYGRKWLISMVARVMQPGCKVDTVPILEGPQGQMKSALLRTLAGSEYFTDHVPDLASKDAQMQLAGMWLVEFAEYGNLGRADANRAKNFITIQVDQFRKPYESLVEKERRQCVLAVTLNLEAHPYLKDVTGNRRFWPMQCGATWPEGRQIDVAAFARERPVLLAEAYHCHGMGETWWLHEPALIEAHYWSVAERVDGGPLFDRVAQALQALVEREIAEPSYSQVCAEMGLLSARDQSLSLQKQVGHAVTLLGWRKKRAREGGVRGMFYTRGDIDRSVATTCHDKHIPQ